VVAHTRKPAAKADEAPAEAPEVDAPEAAEEPTPTATAPKHEVKDGVSADVQALRDAHANLPVLEVLPTNDGKETQAEVLERLSRERKAQQLGSDLVPDNAPDAE